MGCVVSKREDGTTVAHCQARCGFISDAIQHRYSMADAHAAYAVSLRSLASSLHAFLLPSVDSHDVPTVQSNRNLPPGRPHVQFDTASADVIINRSKHHPKPPKVSFEDPPSRVQNYNVAPYQDPHMAAQNSNFAPYPYTPMESFFSFSMSSSTNGTNIPGSSRASQPKEPVVPPPAVGPPSPDESSWDFLNPFGSYDKYYDNYMPDTSFRKVREEEGIPELEEVRDETEHVFSASKNKRIEKEEEKEEKDIHDHMSRSVETRGSSVGRRSVRISFEKEVHAKETEREVEVEAETVMPTRVFHDDLEVVLEIKTQFEKAADVAETVAGLLEAGKRYYHFKYSIKRVAGRLFCGLPSIPNSINDESNYEQFNDMGNNRSLSITLQKLYVWETKLLEEVQNEEILREKYQRECNEMKRLDERGSDPEKIDEIRSSITKISTRIRITLQVLHSISNKIIQIRDEELWPQICELVQELMKMWEIMLECHQAQLNAISQAKTIDSILFSGRNLSDSQMEATKKLQLDLLSWLTSFSTWIDAQRNCVKSLNSWLQKGINYEPEITEDGEAPFSPGRLGLSPVFIILNNWSEIIDNISEVNAVEAIKLFYDGVFQLREKQKIEQHQILTENKDLKAIRTMEREERLLLKELKTKNRKLISTGSGSAPETNSLKSNLRRIFESMEGFASANARAYEELHMHSEEESSFVN